MTQLYGVSRSHQTLGFLFPLVVHALLDNVGFRWTLRIWALMTFVLAGIAVMGIKPRIPVPKFAPGQPRPRIIPSRTDFLNSPLFWTFVSCILSLHWQQHSNLVWCFKSVVTILQALSYSPVSLYIATFATMVSSPLNATVVLSLFNSAGAIGQVLVGLLTDSYPYPWIMFSTALASGIAAFLLWGFADTLTRVFIFAVIFGGLVRAHSCVILCLRLIFGTRWVVFHLCGRQHLANALEANQSTRASFFRVQHSSRD